MANQKPKSNRGDRNPNRKNGKAAKKNPGSKNHREKLSAGDLFLLGKGPFANVKGPGQAGNGKG